MFTKALFDIYLGDVIVFDNFKLRHIKADEFNKPWKANYGVALRNIKKGEEARFIIGADTSDFCVDPFKQIEIAA